MKVYKFGGASVKDADGVRNLVTVLQKLDFTKGILVVSAMGKMTNAFEKMVTSYFFEKESISAQIESIANFHKKIAQELFGDKSQVIFSEIDIIIEEVKSFVKRNTSTDYNYVYDQIVSKAELLSTKICSEFIKEKGIEITWLDVRKCIKTNNDFRRAKVDWEKTTTQIKSQVNNTQLYITQGFIAGNDKNTTTLGREGSDYTAAIFAYCLDAEEVTIFKDVAGVLNADPKVFKETILLNQISYKEAIEMAFFGASVIHPKTIQPLQKKIIPLYVKSFLNPLQRGTKVCKGLDLEPKVPCFIVKKNQILLSISDKEFHFVMENDISQIFDYLHTFRLKVNLIQNSAISFTVCIEDNFNGFDLFIQKIKTKYKVLYNRNVELYTIRHFTENSIQEIGKNKMVLLKQTSRETTQLVMES